MAVSDARRLKELQLESNKLKKLWAGSLLESRLVGEPQARVADLESQAKSAPPGARDQQAHRSLIGVRAFGRSPGSLPVIPECCDR